MTKCKCKCNANIVIGISHYPSISTYESPLHTQHIKPYFLTGCFSTDSETETTDQTISAWSLMRLMQRINAIFTNKLENAATTCAALSLFSVDTGVWYFATCDECVQEIRGRSAKHLLQKLQRCCHHIMIPVLRVVQGQFIDLRNKE